MKRPPVLHIVALLVVAGSRCAAAVASAVTDWDATATALAAPAAAGERELAIMHVAIFDAVNSLEHRYRPYLAQLPAASGASAEAAAAAAAAAVLTALHPQKADEVQSALTRSLASIPDAAAKADGVKLGEAMAARILAARAHDGADAPDAYRPRTTPGQYVATPILVGSTWPGVLPFVLQRPDQFRPPPPPALSSREWIDDYNEIKDYGGKSSSKRSAQQTETARFWLMVGAPAYHPIARQLSESHHLSLLDSARFLALYSMALTDAYIAVFDAKYHYEFWRPITAIRNGDLGGNPATARDATWQPLDTTPLHPEYPCAHCIESGAAAAVIEAVLGTAEIPEVALTSSTAPGVTHRWANLTAFTDEVAVARIYAGFHYRTSTRVGTDMGRRIGQYAVAHVMQASAAESGAR